MDLRGAFTHNWPYKVAAVVLSVLLWLNVAADRERNDQQVATRLVVEVTDSAWTVREVMPVVTTIFEGRGGDIFSLLNQPTIRKVIDTVDDTLMEVPLSPSEVVYDRSLNVRPTAVVPGRVPVRFESLMSRLVPVVAVSAARAPPGFVVEGPQVDPDSVRIRGPRSLVLSVSHLETERWEAGELTQGADRQLAIALPPELAGLEISPPAVLASVEVDSVLARRFEVAVDPTGPYAASARIDPPQVRVEVRGGAGAVRALQPTDLRVTVYIDVPIDAARSFAVTVELPAGVSANAVADPPRITVTPASGVSGPASRP